MKTLLINDLPYNLVRSHDSLSTNIECVDLSSYRSFTNCRCAKFCTKGSDLTEAFHEIYASKIGKVSRYEGNMPIGTELLSPSTISGFSRRNIFKLKSSH